jgi:hypothetical protein
MISVCFMTLGRDFAGSGLRVMTGLMISVCFMTLGQDFAKAATAAQTAQASSEAPP